MFSHLYLTIYFLSVKKKHTHMSHFCFSLWFLKAAVKLKVLGKIT